MVRSSFVTGLLVLGACSGSSVPMQGAVPPRIRPDWTHQIGLQQEAIAECIALRERPRWVVFVDSLPSGATGVNTVDAHGVVEHCAYLDGRVVRREPARFTGVDVAEAGGVLFSPGSLMPVMPTKVVLEEVLEDDKVVGWLYWPQVASGHEEGGEDGQG